jgi:hypothetical protein
MQPSVSRSVAVDIQQLHALRSNRIEAGSLETEVRSKLQYFADLSTRVQHDVMCREGAAVLPLIVGPVGQIMVVFASASTCECKSCLSQEMHPFWSAAFLPYPLLVPGFPCPSADIAVFQAFKEELSWNHPDDDSFAWNTAIVSGNFCFHRLI